jgi:hypothetical protein
VIFVSEIDRVDCALLWFPRVRWRVRCCLAASPTERRVPCQLRRIHHERDTAGRGLRFDPDERDGRALRQPEKLPADLLRRSKVCHMGVRERGSDQELPETATGCVLLAQSQANLAAGQDVRQWPPRLCLRHCEPHGVVIVTHELRQLQ